MAEDDWLRELQDLIERGGQPAPPPPALAGEPPAGDDWIRDLQELIEINDEASSASPLQQSSNQDPPLDSILQELESILAAPPAARRVERARRPTEMGLSIRCLSCYYGELSSTIQVCPKCGSPVQLLLRDMLPPGMRLRDGKYELHYALGRGGYGITYRGTDVERYAPIAIKEFFPSGRASRFSGGAEVFFQPRHNNLHQRSVNRFMREAKILSELNHSGIVRVRDYFEDNGTAYIVMDLVDGRTLDEILGSPPNRTPLAEPEVSRIVEQIVSALSAVHAANVFHLDLKPENIFLNSDNNVVLVDFGAARHGDTLTTTQQFTLAYAPIEVITRRTVGAGSDLFSLGMVAHELLTGTLPPSAIERDENGPDVWIPSNRIGERWKRLLTEALQMQRNQRPPNVVSWWERT